jgi:tryptophan 2,3-dioxygenase
MWDTSIADDTLMLSQHTYERYLALDQLLNCQHPQTQADSELLFITIHQANELWFKLLIHELEHAIAALYDGNELLAYKILARISQVLQLLVRTWDVLSTLTPDEFRVFRSTVGQDNASGFQSYQYRQVEFLLGIKSRTKPLETPSGEHHIDIITMHADATIQQVLLEQWKRPSIYDATCDLLRRRFPHAGVLAPPQDEDFSRSHPYSREVYHIWYDVYSHPKEHMSLFQLAEKLVDIEDIFRQWRFRHLTTVARVIGQNTGTGGSTGLRYLQRVAIDGMEHVLFPEIWEVRNHLYEALPDPSR